MGLFDKFKKNKNDSMKQAEVYVSNESFYADKEGNIFGAYSLTEDVLTGLPLDPKNMFKYQGQTVETWKLLLVSTTKKCCIGELDYYLALDKLKQFSIGENNGYLIVNPLTLEEQMSIVDEKLNIENTESIDSLAYEQDTKKLIMLISDGMDWVDVERHMFLLQAKLNSYIGYIDTKQYLEYIERVKEQNGLNELPIVDTIEIRIGFLFKEPQICSDFIEKALKPKISELFNNVDIIVEHGTK